MESKGKIDNKYVRGNSCIFFVTLDRKYVDTFAEIYKKMKKDNRYLKKLVTELRHPYSEKFLPPENMLSFCYRYHEKAYLSGMVCHCTLKVKFEFSTDELCNNGILGRPYPSGVSTKTNKQRIDNRSKYDTRYREQTDNTAF